MVHTKPAVTRKIQVSAGKTIQNPEVLLCWKQRPAGRAASGELSSEGVLGKTLPAQHAKGCSCSSGEAVRQQVGAHRHPQILEAPPSHFSGFSELCKFPLSPSTSSHQLCTVPGCVGTMGTEGGDELQGICELPG